MNYFLGLNIADSPASIFQTAIAAGSVLMIIAALLVPVLSALTQWLNTKLMSTQNDTQPTSGGAADTMAATMKSMNVMMPIMSAVFCFTLPVGMGIYWIIGAVVRSIQQLVVNKHIDKMDLDDIVKKNIEKANKSVQEGASATEDYKYGEAECKDNRSSAAEQGRSCREDSECNRLL